MSRYFTVGHQLSTNGWLSLMRAHRLPLNVRYGFICRDESISGCPKLLSMVLLLRPLSSADYEPDLYNPFFVNRST